MRSRAVVASLAALALCASACSPKTVETDGYKPGVTPGIARAGVEKILGKPTQTVPFELEKIKADIMTYPFGQVLLQHDRVVAVTIASDQQYVGPMGITLGMLDDQVKQKLRAAGRRRVGHRDSYDLIAGTTDTRTRDLYDDTDHLIIEMAAANPNDPEAPFHVISITLANPAGASLMSSVTQAKVSGLYPDQHVDNFVSDPWHM